MGARIQRRRHAIKRQAHKKSADKKDHIGAKSRKAAGNNAGGYFVAPLLRVVARHRQLIHPPRQLRPPRADIDRLKNGVVSVFNKRIANMLAPKTNGCACPKRRRGIGFFALPLNANAPANCGMGRRRFQSPPARLPCMTFVLLWLAVKGDNARAGGQARRHKTVERKSRQAMALKN